MGFLDLFFRFNLDIMDLKFKASFSGKKITKMVFSSHIAECFKGVEIDDGKSYQMYCETFSPNLIHDVGRFLKAVDCTIFEVWKDGSCKVC